MALTDDQKAMLRLLSQRGEEGYDDIAALMGISVEEVRERVKEALAEVAGPGTAAPEAQEPEPTPAPPPPPAPQPSQPVVEQPPPPQPVGRPIPGPTSAAAKAPAAGSPTGKQPPRLPRVKLPKDRGALIGLGAGALVLVIFIIVLVVSGGDSSSTDTTASTEGSQGGTTPAASENLTQAVLSPVDGSDASGTALFGRFKKNVLLQVTAEGLEPSQSGQSYAIWLSHSGKAMVPVGTAKVPDSGDLAARFQIPTAVLVLVARSAFNEINVTRTTDAALNASIAKARQSKSESAYTGTDVMSGKITGPFVGSAKK